VNTSVELYLETLPHGVASYPQVLSKASLLRSLLDSTKTPPERLCAVLPREVHEAVQEPPPVTAWLPSVHFRCIFRAVRDACFQSDESFLRFCRDAQRRMFEGPVYRVLMAALSPQAILKGSTARWGRFHQGIELTIAPSSGAVQGTLRYPPHLLQEIDHLATLEGWRAAVELAGGKNVTSRVLLVTPTEARFVSSWT